MENDNQDKQNELKRIAIEAISKECTKPSEHSDVLVIANGLASGRELDLTVLTGGLCNYSYKVHFKDENDGDVALFAKQTFGTPLLFPDVPCSRERTNFEYEAMEMYGKISPYPESTVTPYFCIDVEVEDKDIANMKILATQFCPNNLNEQAANVFVDGGLIGTAFASKAAKGLAALHNAPVTDPNFNSDMKPFFLALSSIQPNIFEEYLSASHDESKNEGMHRPSEYAQSLGRETLNAISKGYQAGLMRTDCYVHGDAHAFNILVEGKPKTLTDLVESFQQTTVDESGYKSDADGNFCLIDWEMTHVGPIGKDLGWFYTFPIACLLAHAAHGDTVSSESILRFLKVFWGDYSEAINLEEKPDLSKLDIYRQLLGYMGILISGYSALGIHLEYLPIEEGKTGILDKIREGLGVIGLKAMKWGFVDTDIDVSVEDLERQLWEAVQEETDRLAPLKRPRNRRSSLLRDTGRRGSDAHAYLASEEFDRRRSSWSNEPKRESLLDVEKVAASLEHPQ